MNTCCDKEENLDNTTKFSSFQEYAEILDNSFATLINDDDSDTDGETEPVSETEDYDLLVLYFEILYHYLEILLIYKKLLSVNFRPFSFMFTKGRKILTLCF